MQTDAIEAIGIDGGGSLWVKPRTTTFPHIYREAMEVHWDVERLCLYTPKPREFPDLNFTPLQWFHRVLAATKEQGVTLMINEETAWIQIEGDLRREISA